MSSKPAPAPEVLPEQLKEEEEEEEDFSETRPRARRHMAKLKAGPQWPEWPHSLTHR